jgi:hypothetical protein
VAAWQVKADVADPPAVRVTPATALQIRPVDGLAVNETAPAKPFTDITVTVDVPELVARTPAGVTAPRETVKVGTAPTATETVVVLESVFGVVPVVPVIVKVKVAGLGTAVQLTVKTVPETLAVQPVGAALVENATVPENPLIAVNDNVEVLGVPTTTLSEDGLADTEKSTTWKVTEFDGMF